MRQFIISSIEDVSSRFGFEANQMLRALPYSRDGPFRHYCASFSS